MSNVSVSSLGYQSAPVAQVLWRPRPRPLSRARARPRQHLNRILTDSEQYSWLQVSFSRAPVRVRLKSYALTHYSSDGNALRSWRLQAANSETSAAGSWHVLREHRNDTTLGDSRGSYRRWPLDDTNTAEYYRLFRLVQTGANSSGNHNLCLSRIELYGQLEIMSGTAADAAVTVEHALPQQLQRQLRQSQLQQRQKTPSGARFVTEVSDYGVANSFGYAFDYWHAEHTLYVALKFENLKDELLGNPIYALADKDSFDVALQRVLLQLATFAVVKQLVSADGVPISADPLLALLFYCNFARLCRAFRRTYFKVAATESIAELLGRHRNFRSWGRLLRELVETYGTSMHASQCPTFYHALAVPPSTPPVPVSALFASVYSKFYCPTSTTTDIRVALDLPRRGRGRGRGQQQLLLELNNDRNKNSRYFDCAPFSDFGELQAEKLMIGGAEPVPLAGIRSIDECKDTDTASEYTDYSQFVLPIAIFEFMLRARACTVPVRGTHRRTLQALIDMRLCADTELARLVAAPQFAQTLFASVCDNLQHIDIDVQLLNRGHVRMRAVLCECYDRAQLAANSDAWSTAGAGAGAGAGTAQKAFVNPVKNLKFELLARLLPALRRVHIRNLPMNDFVVEAAVRAFAGTARQRPRIEFSDCEAVYVGQSAMTFQECAQRFAHAQPTTTYNISLDVARNLLVIE